MKFLKSICILCFFVVVVNAQFSKKDIILTIDNYKITANEFLQSYKKNNQPSAGVDESIEEYFNLFLNFKLKVVEAMDSKLDTLTSYKNEFKEYRNQLAKSYLTDSAALNNLIKEAYFRTSTETNISHIMISLNENAMPDDTLKAYNKINDIRNRILKGESFEQLARELSDDPSAKTNNGYLGYTKAFKFPYSFESAAFNTPIGKISEPFRTRFGYHIIKVNNKRSSPGEIKVAHIMVTSPQSDSDSSRNKAKVRINDIYKRLQNGAPFDSLAIGLSEDSYSARNGGELPWFGAGDMVPEFEDAAFNLKHKGEFSEPIQTFYGWHIIKLLDTKPIASFESLQNEIKSKITQNDRFQVVEKSFINNLKKKYSWKTYPLNLQKLESVNDTIKILKKLTPAVKLLTIGNSTFTSEDYINYLNKLTNLTPNKTAKNFISDKFRDFTDHSFLQIADSDLEKNNNSFKLISQEYHDGLLLYEIMEREVWSKASKDTLGIEKFYNLNLEKYNNPHPQKLEEIKGRVISDYQTYLDDKWVNELKKNHKITVNTKLLNKIATNNKTKTP